MRIKVFKKYDTKVLYEGNNYNRLFFDEKIVIECIRFHNDEDMEIFILNDANKVTFKADGFTLWIDIV